MKVVRFAHESDSLSLMKVIRFAHVRFSHFRSSAAIFVAFGYHFRGYAAINAPQALICIHPTIG